MDSEPARGIDRRRLVTWGGLGAAGLLAAGSPLLGAGDATAGTDRLPPDTRPGGAYDRLLGRLAAEGRFSGVAVLAYRGRTVLSRSYGLADRERGIANQPGTAYAPPGLVSGG